MSVLALAGIQPYIRQVILGNTKVRDPQSEAGLSLLAHPPRMLAPPHTQEAVPAAVFECALHTALKHSAVAWCN